MSKASMGLLSVLFGGWEDTIESLIAAPIIYIFVVGAIRISSKRSTSQMITPDWIVPVVIGFLTAFGILGKKILRRSETDIDTTAYWPWKILELRIIVPDLCSDCQVMI